jgi:hypothetical protein
MQTLLRYLLKDTIRVYTLPDVAAESGIPYGTLGSLVHRLASIGWVEIREGPLRARPFQLTQEGAAGARVSLGYGAPAGRVWTLTELRAAVQRGDEPKVLLDAAVREINLSRQEVARAREDPRRV